MEIDVRHLGICKLVNFISKQVWNAENTLINRYAKFGACAFFSFQNILRCCAFISSVTVLVRCRCLYMPCLRAKIWKNKIEKKFSHENALMYHQNFFSQ